MTTFSRCSRTSKCYNSKTTLCLNSLSIRLRGRVQTNDSKTSTAVVHRQLREQKADQPLLYQMYWLIRVSYQVSSIRVSAVQVIWVVTEVVPFLTPKEFKATISIVITRTPRNRLATVSILRAIQSRRIRATILTILRHRLNRPKAGQIGTGLPRTSSQGESHPTTYRCSKMLGLRTKTVREVLLQFSSSSSSMHHLRSWAWEPRVSNDKLSSIDCNRLIWLTRLQLRWAPGRHIRTKIIVVNSNLWNHR